MEEIKEKANYCLSCKVKPCVKGCPLNNDITDFIAKIKEKKYKDAYDILTNTTVLSSVCGRICPHEKQCEGSCIRGIKGNPVSIGKLEAFIGDMAIIEGWKLNKEDTFSNKRVAIIGGGPTGLTAGAFLARKGVNVTIFDKSDKLGGILYKGIPEFRLEKDILKKTINKILELGIKVEVNKELEKNIFLSNLEKEYDAVLLAFGANISNDLEISGENLLGVYGGNELLERGDFPDFNGKSVAVIGGGNVAMDVSRTIKRLGTKNVYVVYRRAERQMPAEIKEIDAAKKEGVKFLFQNNIVKIIGNEKVEGVELIKTELIKKEGELRESFKNIDGSNYILNVDYVVKAVGSKTQVDLLNKLKIEVNEKKYIKVDETYQTSHNNVYAAGDLIGTKSTIAWAARSGRNAAEEIIKKF